MFFYLIRFEGSAKIPQRSSSFGSGMLQRSRLTRSLLRVRITVQHCEGVESERSYLFQRTFRWTLQGVLVLLKIDN